MWNNAALIIFNTASTAQTLSHVPDPYPPGTKIQNLMDAGETLTTSPGDLVPNFLPAITVPAESAKIFVAARRVRPLDPVVTAVSPAHDAKQIQPTAPIVLHFSRPMDTNSVQKAFGTAPSVSGSFSWNAQDDTLTFTPADPGYPANSLVAVHLADTADSATSGLHFHAAFESRFQTR